MIAAVAVAASLVVAPSARAMQPGELVVVSVSDDRPITAVHARVFDTDVAGFKDDETHWRVLVGIDLDVKPGRYPLDVVASVGAGPEETRVMLTVLPKAFPTRRLKVDPDFVNPPAGVQARIEAESAEQRAIWAASVHERLWTRPFVRPVTARANSAFGTRSIFNGEPRGAHGGADFLSPAGTPIKAPNAGRVVLAKNLYYSGNTVIIDHGLGVFSFLCHMSRIDVKAGDDIAAGRVVGLVGATGRVTGPHLHWTARVAGARVDPLSILALLGAPPRGRRLR